MRVKMLVRMTSAWVCLLGIFASVTVFGQSKPSTKASPPVCTAHLIKRAVLSSKYVYTHLPNEGASLDKELYSRIFDLVDVSQSLLYEFNHLNSPEDLRVLATLLCFDVGEGPSEVIQCIVLRKGKRILSYLEKLQAESSLKDAVTDDVQVDWTAKDDARAHEILGAMIQKIKKKHSCAD